MLDDWMFKCIIYLVVDLYKFMYSLMQVNKKKERKKCILNQKYNLCLWYWHKPVY